MASRKKTKLGTSPAKRGARSAVKSSMKKEAQAGKGTWGGRRPGAGRPKGSGKGPSPDARRNRVAVMFSDHELELLRRLARKAGIPLSTLAHRSCIKGLERLR